MLQLARLGAMDAIALIAALAALFMSRGVSLGAEPLPAEPPALVAAASTPLSAALGDAPPALCPCGCVATGVCDCPVCPAAGKTPLAPVRAAAVAVAPVYAPGVAADPFAGSACANGACGVMPGSYTYTGFPGAPVFASGCTSGNCSSGTAYTTSRRGR